jgi:RNA polymerase sigma factor (sigma-70 family)
VEDTPTLEQRARSAASGDRQAAEHVLAALQGPIYRLAVRMLGHPHDAEDATQEILVIVLTHLSSFRGDSALTTWAWRIAANYLLRARRGRLEIVTFDTITALLDREHRDDTAAIPAAELHVLAREVRLRCTEAMLLALDRDLRIAFALGEILGLANDEAAAVLELEPATYRKRLSRARARLIEFLRSRCGVYDDGSRCRCTAQVASAVERHQLQPDEMLYAIHPARSREVERVVDNIDELMRAADVLRHPEYTAPAAMIDRVRALVARGGLELFDD